MRVLAVILCFWICPGICFWPPCWEASRSVRGDDSAATAAPGRPVMRQLGVAGAATALPTAQDIVGARPVFRRRFRQPLAHTASAAGARQAAETLLAAADTETDRTIRWLLFDESRRLGEASGQAGIIARAIAAASAAFDFDAIEAELKSLRQIPLQGLDASRAAGVAMAAERIAVRATTDDRPDKTVAAEMLAYRAWQRAGDMAAAARAAIRHDTALVELNAAPTSR